ncbi:hypothetical protein FGG08_004284 [Glutinoglossum americanum]|uniref:NAD(P)-binding protein n=1 Tax=Glutinoglossum americanum TaxID=1670608 RepID=A0A9P8I0R6_9PEZI|nr:hypothetical protein FGG08_004284 [Glutinoglossum americanum]
MPTILIIGATRGLGSALLSAYAAHPTNTIYGTTRSPTAPPSPPSNTHWIPSIDLLLPTAASAIASAIPKTHPIDILIISAGIFPKESLGAVDWEGEVKTYTTSAIAPVFIVHELVGAGLLGGGAKVVLVGSEAGSVALRHEKEGGGNYAHHGSKAAVSMVGKLLSLDLKDRGVAVGVVHPGFMRTDMTKGVGFDQYYESGGGKLEPKLNRSVSPSASL